MLPKKQIVKGAQNHVLPPGMSFMGYDYHPYEEECLSLYSLNPLAFDWRAQSLERAFRQHCAASYQRKPTAEEADKNARELIEEEEREKEKAARNMNKKMRKNEKKRLAKENAVKENASASLQSEEQRLNQLKIEDDTSSVGSDISAESFLSSNHVGDEDNKESKGASKMMNGKQKEKPKATAAHPAEKQQPHQVERNPETKPEKSTPAEACLQQSTQLAASGNQLAAKGQYEMAVKCFTDAIKLNPLEFKLFGNRSLCLERMQRYDMALADADVALSMEPKWIKGLFRKGKALCGLKRYYDASLVFQELLDLDASSAEARKELERTQTLHLMEMGFSQEQCSAALRSQPTLEEALQSLFDCSHSDDQSVEGEDEWTVLGPHRPKPRQLPEPDEPKETSPKVNGVKKVFLRPKSAVKQELPTVVVSSIAPSVTYAVLYQLFSRVGSVFSIKMLLDSQCAFVVYKLKEECDRALQLDGTVLEGSPLTVQHCDKRTRVNADFSSSTPGGKRECFFWRTIGCTRDGCTYRHVPEHKGIDKDKFNDGHFHP